MRHNTAKWINRWLVAVFTCLIVGDAMLTASFVAACGLGFACWAQENVY